MSEEVNAAKAVVLTNIDNEWNYMNYNQLLTQPNFLLEDFALRSVFSYAVFKRTGGEKRDLVSSSYYYPSSPILT